MLNLKHKITKDIKNRKINLSQELPIFLGNIIANNKILLLNKRMLIGSTVFSYKSKKTSLKNRCLISGRARATFKRFKLSRIKFKEWASRGYIPGVQRSSW